jgi:transposase
MKGRKAQIPESVFAHDFSKLSKKEGHARTRQRFLALSHLQDGATITDVANYIKVARSTVYDWINRLEKEGLEGLREKEGRGAIPKLTKEHHEAFKQSVLELQNNRTGGRIRGSDILNLMREKFGVDCSMGTVYKTLARLDLVWISGRSKHPKSDQQAQEAFKKTSKKL